MARAIWNGSISFGLVNVPVRLFGATKSKDVHFHQLQESTGARVRYKKVSEKSGRELDADDIVRGYEVSDGRYVTLTDEELAAVEPERSHTITVEDFVPWESIDPMHFESTYWVTPDDSKGAKKAYALLLKAMEDTGRVGIGRFVMRTKEHLVTLRPANGAIALHGMLFPDEVVPAKDVDALPVRAEVGTKEVRMAKDLIDSLSAEWDPKRYKDTHRAAVLKMVKRKAEGKEIVTEAPEPKGEEFEDLLAALEASVSESKARRRRSPRPRKAAARKRTAKRASKSS